MPRFEGRASMLVSYIVRGSNSLAKVQTELVIPSAEDRVDAVDGSQRDSQGTERLFPRS